jgi:hypothetical protein
MGPKGAARQTTGCKLNPIALVSVDGITVVDRLCGLVARVHCYRPKSRGFYSRRYQISESWWVWRARRSKGQ